VRVVQLRGPVRIELVEGLAPHQVQTDHVLEGAGDEEELLREPQFLSCFGLVVRIEHFRNRLRRDFLVDRAVVVANVERLEIEGFSGLRLPQPQQVRGGRPISGHRRVVSDTLDHFLRNPPYSIPALVVDKVFRTPAVHDVECHFRTHDLPGVAEAQPLIGQLDLPAVLNRLIEDPELVSDAITNSRNVERRQRVHVARGQAAQPPVA
jgi:hypothetical protein